MDSKEWQRHSEILKNLLNLDLSPVAISRLDKPPEEHFDRKVRVCRGLLQASKGETVQIGKDNNACFGAAWHMGFEKIKSPKIIDMIKKFVVEGEKLFCSYEALDNLLAQMEDVPDHSECCFILSPMERAEFAPELVIFVCDPEAACRILTLAIFVDGQMPKIKIGGPTCRMAITYPLVTGEINISFYDYTARKMSGIEKDKLLVAIPYKRMPSIIDSIDTCSAGRAKIEYSQEFREFLQKRFASKEEIDS